MGKLPVCELNVWVQCLKEFNDTSRALLRMREDDR